jgi:FMN reductase
MMIRAIGDLRITAIGGSLRERSCTYLALEHVTRALAGFGVHVTLLDLRRMILPFCDGDSKNPRPDYPDVALLRNAVESAHALILATPEYHGGISGVLKNALDLLSPEHLQGKVAGLISVLGGVPSSNALNDLGRILRCCHAWVLPEYIVIPRAHAAFTGGVLTDPDLLSRFDRFAQNLVWSAARMTETDRQVGPLSSGKGVIHENFSSSLPGLRSPDERASGESARPSCQTEQASPVESAGAA